MTAPLSHGRTAVSLALALFVGSTSACRHHGDGTPVATARQIPEGEVWLTPAETTHMGVTIAPTQEQPVDDTVVTAGRVTFDDLRVTHVFSPVSGRITRIFAQLGERVHRGDPLAAIESPDVGIASSDVGKAEADVIAAEHDLRRKRELYAVHAAAQADVEQSEDNERRAQAELQRARQRMRLMARGTVNVVTQTYTVRALIDGEVVARGANPGVEVQGQYSGGATLELFTIGELNRVWVLGDLYQVDFPRVTLGTPASIQVAGFGDRAFTGTVDWIAGAMDPATRTARVRVVLDNADRALRPEMYATMSLRVDARRALALPRAAVLHLGDQAVVFVDRGLAADGRHRFGRVPVTADEAVGGRWLPVTSGIAVGTPVVTSGAIQFVDLLETGSAR